MQDTVNLKPMLQFLGQIYLIKQYKIDEKDSVFELIERFRFVPFKLPILASHVLLYGDETSSS